MLKFINDQQIGIKSNRSFRSCVTKLKVSALPRISTLLKFPNCINSYHRIKQSFDGTPIFLCNFGSGSRLYNAKFKYSKYCTNMKNDNVPEHFVKEMHCNPLPFLTDALITDYCCAYYNNSFYSVGLTGEYDNGCYLNRRNSRTTILKHWSLQDTALSLDMNASSNKIAVGCATGYHLFDIHATDVLSLYSLYQTGNMDEMNESVLFDDSGNILYIGSKCHGIFALDTRVPTHRISLRNNSHYHSSNFSRPKNISAISVHDMKLLDDNVSLVVSDNENQMMMVDLRMNRVIFNYCETPYCLPGHGFKRRLSINEDLNLICRAENDNQLRIWDLRSGELLLRNHLVTADMFDNPFSKDEVYSFIISEQRTFFVCLIHKKTVSCIYPSL